MTGRLTSPNKQCMLVQVGECSRSEADVSLRKSSMFGVHSSSRPLYEEVRVLWSFFAKCQRSSGAIMQVDFVITHCDVYLERIQSWHQRIKFGIAQLMKESRAN